MAFSFSLNPVSIYLGSPAWLFPHKFIFHICLLFQYTHTTCVAPHLSSENSIELYIKVFFFFDYVNHGDLEKMVIHKHYSSGGVNFFPTVTSAAANP